MDNTRFSTPLEIKVAADAGGGVVAGYASTWGGPPDSHGDIVAKGAYLRTLAEHKAEGSQPLMLWAHDQAEPIGRWTELREDERGLFVRGTLNLDTARGRDAFAHVKAGDVSGLSVGYMLGPHGFKSGGNGTRILTDVDLFEISVVAIPSNRRARVHLESKRELEELLTKSGLPKQAAVRIASGGWPALAGADPEEAALKIRNAAARITRAAELLRKA
ncbi:HK97 family phage prohead protease [Terrihabitans sp. B22-R8]|uniref:HK97 family phage prohead protease n=1 Tax=Terrihabitans sp. B22-R8 TaxID=3425128 RepID=UPI00403D32F4